MNVHYQNTLEDVNAGMLHNFFFGWPEPPSNEDLYSILKNSAYIQIAISDGKVVGFVNAISDKTLSAYIPLLEVLPKYQGKGVANELMKQLMAQLKHLYMVDLCCDDDLVDFYKKMDFIKSNGMLYRNYDALKK